MATAVDRTVDALVSIRRDHRDVLVRDEPRDVGVQRPAQVVRRGWLVLVGAAAVQQPELRELPGGLGGKRIRMGYLLVLGLAAAAGNQAQMSFSHGEHGCPFPAQEIARITSTAGIAVLLAWRLSR